MKHAIALTKMRRALHGKSGRVRMAHCFRVSLLACTCASALAATAGWAQVQSGGTVSGRVMAAEGLPDQMKVQLMAEGDLMANETYTDSNGTFAFTGLPNGTYWLVVQVRGFRPVRQVAVVDLQVMARLQVDINLERTPDEPTPTGLIIVGSPRSYKLNAKNGDTFNTKAIREFEKANKLQQEQNLRGAIAHYQKALSIEPNFYPALNNLGALYLREKDAARAETTLSKSIEVNPEDGEAYINLGHVLYEEGKYQSAVDRLEEGLKRSPQSAVGHFLMGSTWLKLGQLDKAERALRMARSLDPGGMPSARLQLANLYLKRQDMQAASVELESYLQANPSDPQAAAIKKMLANIKAH